MWLGTAAADLFTQLLHCDLKPKEQAGYGHVAQGESQPIWRPIGLLGARAPGQRSGLCCGRQLPTWKYPLAYCSGGGVVRT